MSTVRHISGTWVSWHETMHVLGKRLASSRLQKASTLMAAPRRKCVYHCIRQIAADMTQAREDNADSMHAEDKSRMAWYDGLVLLGILHTYQHCYCSPSRPVPRLINDKNCSLSVVLTAMDQKLQKS